MSRNHQISKYLLLVGLLTVFLVACSPASSKEDPAAAEVEEDPTPTAVEDVDEPTEESGDESSDSDAADTPDEVARTEPAEESDETSAVDNAEESGHSNPDSDTSETAAATKLGSNGKEILTEDNRTDMMREITADWDTDWTRHTVPYNELLPVLFRDAIQSLDNPKFQSLDEAARWMNPTDPVMAVEINGKAKAYPLRIMASHEIVNDTLGGVPIVVTYCPLCNSALVFDARFDGQELEFGTSGWLRNSDLVMYDRTTDSLWQQFTGEGIVGEYAGERLSILPSSLVSLADFSQAYPDGSVLSNETGFRFPYDSSAYAGYDSPGQSPYLFFGDIDPRLPATARVVTVSTGNLDIAYPVSTIAKKGAINDTRDGQDMVIFHTDGTTSAFFNPLTNRFDDVGATGVFDPNLNGETLTFSEVDGEIVDDQTGSTWNILGQAIAGPLSGEELQPIVHADHFWFSWAAFKPDTVIYDP